MIEIPSEFAERHTPIYSSRISDGFRWHRWVCSCGDESPGGVLYEEDAKADHAHHVAYRYTRYLNG